MNLQSINPANGHLIQEYPVASNHEVQIKLKNAEKAFEKWKKSSFQQRKEVMVACARILNEEIESLSHMIHIEMGKMIAEARAEIEKCAWVCNYYAQHAEQFLENETLPITEKKVEVVFQPLGAILAIMPWNFPFWQVFRFAAPAIMAGNVGVLKHASNVSGCALAIEKVLLKAGAPKGVFQTLLISTQQVETVINHKAIKAVTLTGSEKAGSDVAAIAGKNIKKTVLELGGSDPFLVLEDADIATAVQTGVLSRMRNAGQSCIAAKRFIILEELFDDFISQFKLEVGKLVKDKDYGPMAREDLALELENQVNESVELGAKLICGGHRDGAYYEPSILINVKPGMPAFQDELFGPVAAMLKVKNVEEAIQFANNSKYGLGASIWTKNSSLAREVAEKLEVGGVFINQMVASDPQIPFGGVKNSGYGRELGLWGIREFVNVKPIVS